MTDVLRSFVRSTIHLISTVIWLLANASVAFFPLYKYHQVQKETGLAFSNLHHVFFYFFLFFFFSFYFSPSFFEDTNSIVARDKDEHIDIRNFTLSLHFTLHHVSISTKNWKIIWKTIKSWKRARDYPFYVNTVFQWIDYRALQIIEDYLRR